MVIADSSKLVFMGDSITDCNRAKPVEEGLFEALGNGYVNLVAAHLGAACPEKHIRVVNMGTSGNTVRDLAAWWQTDALDLQPDWLSILIGINDVWRQFDSPLQPEISVGIDEYRRIDEHRAVSARHTQAAFDKVHASVHPMLLAWDRVHPGTTGHMVIARALLEAIGL